MQRRCTWKRTFCVLILSVIMAFAVFTSTAWASDPGSEQEGGGSDRVVGVVASVLGTFEGGVEEVFDCVFYVAYGSNLNIDQMDERCPGAQPVCTAKLEGYELVFRNSRTNCFLSVDPKQGSSVDVVVWKVTREDEKELDRREGYPRCYQKKDQEVTLTGEGEGKTMTGVMYYLPQDRQMGPCSEGYLDRVLAGYEHFGFDPAPLYEAYGRACAAV